MQLKLRGTATSTCRSLSRAKRRPMGSFFFGRGVLRASRATSRSTQLCLFEYIENCAYHFFLAAHEITLSTQLPSSTATQLKKSSSTSRAVSTDSNTPPSFGPCKISRCIHVVHELLAPYHVLVGGKGQGIDNRAMSQRHAKA